MVVIFPGVFAVQDDGHQDIGASGGKRLRVRADANEKLAGRFVGAQLRVDKTYFIAQEMIPEDHPDVAVVLIP